MHLPARRRELLEAGQLTLRAGRRTTSIQSAEITNARRDVSEVLRRQLAPLSASARNEISDFLATAAGGFESGSADELSEALFRVRGGLREHLQRPEGWNERRAPASRSCCGSIPGATSHTAGSATATPRCRG